MKRASDPIFPKQKTNCPVSLMDQPSTLICDTPSLPHQSSLRPQASCSIYSSCANITLVFITRPLHEVLRFLFRSVFPFLALCSFLSFQNQTSHSMPSSAGILIGNALNIQNNLRRTDCFLVLNTGHFSIYLGLLLCLSKKF